jgi:hypothetical protein
MERDSMRRDHPGIILLWLRTMAGMALLIVLSGCFGSDVPVITTNTAQNIGGSLDYWSRLAEDPKAEKFRFARGNGNYYHLQLLDPENADESVKQSPDIVLLRRIGKRGSSVMYIVQFDFGRRKVEGLSPEVLGYRYLTYLLSINPRGIGSVGTFKCNAASIHQHAKQANLNVSCLRNELTEDTAFPYLGGRPSPEVIQDFLLALIRDGAIEWEDDTGVGVLDGLF